MTESAQAFDFRGRQIKPNDIIVYPVRQGSNMWLREATVTGIESRRDGVAVVCFDHNGTTQRRLTIKNPDRCVVVE